MRDITIVAQGGGMVAAYHAGVIRALYERFGFTKIRRIVASSGAACVYAYLVSGQEDLIEPIWYYLFESGRFVDPWRHKLGRGVIDIDFLVDDAIKRRFPFNLAAFKKSPILFEVGVTETDTGRSVFFAKDEPPDFYELRRASCAIPYFFGKHINLRGRFYCDGTIGNVLGLEQVADDEKVLIILTRPDYPIRKFTIMRKILRWLLLRGESVALQEKIWSMPMEYNLLYQRIASFSQGRKVCVIRPLSRLPIKRIDNSIKRLTATIQQGYLDTIRTAELDYFWSS